VLNLTPRMLQDSAATPAARLSFALARVQDYFDRVVRGRARFFPIPPFLGEALRARGEWSVDAAGVRRALELAKAVRAAADSVPSPGAPAPPRPDTTSRRGGR
jgi:hypothetical protein